MNKVIKISSIAIQVLCYQDEIFIRNFYVGLVIPVYRSARGTNSIELITKEFTEEDCGRVGEELPNDFLPDNCPAVKSLVPVIFRKAIRDRAFKSFAAALTGVSERSTIEEISSSPFFRTLSIARFFFVSSLPRFVSSYRHFASERSTRR